MAALSPRLLLALVLLALVPGCATLRVSDPPRTADEQFLQSEAIRQAVSQLSFAALRDRRVYVDAAYLFDGNFPSNEQSFMLGELRNRMLIEGVAVATTYGEADIILEVRSGGIGVNREEYVLGVTGQSLPVGSVEAGSLDIPIVLPEFAIVKNLDQRGFAAVSITAYWRTTGELVASSGPFVGRTNRTDFWFFGLKLRANGDIATTHEE